MKGDVDPHLVEFLKGSLALADALQTIGIVGEASVNLNRQDGLRLLELVAGTRDEEAEEWSQQGRFGRPGWNRVKVSDLVFEWPCPPLRRHAAANDNDSGLHDVEWFETDWPAMG